MTTQTFRLGHVLSVTTGLLLCEGEEYPLDGLSRILNYMTGDNVYTHQIPSAMKQCTPYILEQFPVLKEIGKPNITRDNYSDVLQDLKIKYGDEFTLTPIPKNQQIGRLPFDDL